METARDRGMTMRESSEEKEESVSTKGRKERRGSREGRISEDSRKESGVLLKMKESRGDKRVERKQRREERKNQ